MEPIRVWRWEDAPEHLQALSKHGGDEDWVAAIPPELANDWIGWMDEGTSFGCCSVDEFSHPTRIGWKVRIGAHA